MKNKLYIFIALIIILLIASFSFGVWFYYFYAFDNIQEAPLKESISLSLAFLGSFGTLTSIIFAFYFYVEQIEQQQHDAEMIILRNKPKLFIRIEDIYNSEDRNGQPALAVDMKVENYNNTASSFSLNYDYVLNGNKEIIAEFDYPYKRKNILDSGESINITAIFTSSKNIVSPPEFNELNLYIKCVYLDRLNNTIEDYYLIEGSNKKSIKYIKSNILTASGNFIELK